MSKEPKKNQYVGEVNRIFHGKAILEKYKAKTPEDKNRIIDMWGDPASDLKKERRRSFIFPSIISLALFIAFFITYFIYRSQWLFALPIIGFLSFFTLACFFLDNTFLLECWVEGALMTPIECGIFFIIVFPIVFPLVTAFCLLVGIFVYPFAIAKNTREIKQYSR